MANKPGVAETGTAVVCSCWSEGSNVFLSWARLVVGDCWPAKKFILSGAERADWWPEPAGMKDEGSVTVTLIYDCSFALLTAQLLYSKLFFVSLIEA